MAAPRFEIWVTFDCEEHHCSEQLYLGAADTREEAEEKEVQLWNDRYDNILRSCTPGESYFDITEVKSR